jgi:uncharacterized membrane protein YhhN
MPALVIIYLFTSTLYLVLLSQSPYPFQWLIKVIPISLLLLPAARILSRKLSVLLCGAVLASGSGDIVLALPIEHSFTFGLTSFFIAHCLYIGAFLHIKKSYNNSQQHPKEQHKLAVFPLLAITGFALIIGIIILPNTGSLLVPVAAYLFLITGMGLSAFMLRMPALTQAGVVSFLLSDAALAYNLFNGPVANASVVVMSTYYLAQLLIIYGVANTVPSRLTQRQ